MTLVTPEKVFKMHAQLSKDYGSTNSGVIDQDCPERSLIGARQAEYYASVGSRFATEGLVTAAYALYYFAKNHCFVDGNKRVAWHVCLAILNEMGYSVAVTQKEAEEFVKGVAVSTNPDETQQRVLAWLAENLCAHPKRQSK
jgi:death-on-curing protein